VNWVALFYGPKNNIDIKRISPLADTTGYVVYLSMRRSDGRGENRSEKREERHTNGLKLIVSWAYSVYTWYHQAQAGRRNALIS